MNLIHQLTAAYKQASPGEWKSKSCVFKAVDRDFSTLAHNAMPLIFEAMEAFKRLHEAKVEHDPSYRLSMAAVTNGMLLNRMDGIDAQHPLVPVFFCSDEGEAHAQLSLASGEVILPMDWPVTTGEFWIEPLTRGTGAAASRNEGGRFQIDAQDLDELRELYGRGDLVLRRAAPAIVYADDAFIDCVLYVMDSAGCEWKITITLDTSTGHLSRVNEVASSKRADYRETEQPVPPEVDAAYARQQSEVFAAIQAKLASMRACVAAAAGG